MAASSATAAPLPSPPHRSPWHSPVPYLFGGLAAMLGLIAFALVILVCSYWKLSGHPENGDGGGEGDLEAGGGEEEVPPAPEMEEKLLVIMAGQEKPTFLATPMTSRATSFGSKRSCSSSESTTSYERSYEENSREIGGPIGHMGAPGTGPADQVH